MKWKIEGSAECTVFSTEPMRCPLCNHAVTPKREHKCRRVYERREPEQPAKRVKRDAPTGGQ